MSIETPVERPIRIFTLATASVVCFAVMNLFAKLSAEHASIPQIIFFRNLVAFIPLFFILFHQGGLKLLKTSDPLAHFMRGFMGLLAMACFFTSFSMLPLAEATSISFAAPLIVTALSAQLLGERVGPWRWSAVLIGLCGVLIMLKPTGHADPAGSLIALVGACLSAFAMIYIRKMGRTEHALTIVFYFTLFGTIIGGISMLYAWNPIPASALFFLIMTGFLGGMGQILLTYSYAHAPAAYVAPFSYLTIIFSMIFDIVIWSIWPAWNIWTGSLIVAISGLFIVYREATARRRGQTPPEDDQKTTSALGS